MKLSYRRLNIRLAVAPKTAGTKASAIAKGMGVNPKKRKRRSKSENASLTAQTNYKGRAAVAMAEGKR